MITPDILWYLSRCICILLPWPHASLCLFCKNNQWGVSYCLLEPVRSDVGKSSAEDSVALLAWFSSFHLLLFASIVISPPSSRHLFFFLSPILFCSSTWAWRAHLSETTVTSTAGGERYCITGRTPNISFLSAPVDYGVSVFQQTWPDCSCQISACVVGHSGSLGITVMSLSKMDRCSGAKIATTVSCYIPLGVSAGPQWTQLTVVPL